MVCCVWNGSVDLSISVKALECLNACHGEEGEPAELIITRFQKSLKVSLTACVCRFHRLIRKLQEGLLLPVIAGHQCKQNAAALEWTSKIFINVSLRWVEGVGCFLCYQHLWGSWWVQGATKTLLVETNLERHFQLYGKFKYMRYTNKHILKAFKNILSCREKKNSKEI